MNDMIAIRKAVKVDLWFIKQIYNEGIEDRIATLETELKDDLYMEEWFNVHLSRYTVIVAEADAKIMGWASLNPYNSRAAYEGVADLSIYVKREVRGQGVGTKLLGAIEKTAAENSFHKLVLFTFPFNESGQRLYSKMGYREVGVFKNQGKLDGRFVDVAAMEKLLLQP